MKTRFVPLMIAVVAGAVFGGHSAQAAAPNPVALADVTPEFLEELRLAEEDVQRQSQTDTTKKPSSKLQLSSKNINFDDVKVGKSAKRALKLKNVGSDTVVVMVSDSTDPAFVGSPLNKGLTIKPGKSRTIYLTFTPTEKKQYIGKMPIEIISPGVARLRVRVTGRGK